MKQPILQITLTITMMSILMGCAEASITELVTAKKPVIASNEELPELDMDEVIEDLAVEEGLARKEPPAEPQQNAKNEESKNDSEKSSESKSEAKDEPNIEIPRIEKSESQEPKIERPKIEEPKVEPKKEAPTKVPKTAPVPSPAGVIVEKGLASPTIYYLPVIDEDKSQCPRVSPMLQRGRVLITVCHSTFKQCSLEGSCAVVQNGKTRKFNVIGKTSFMEIDDEQVCQFGYGVKSYCLDPFYTLAADLTLYRTGDVIYMESVRGVILPDGSKHSGYFIVRDRGRGIIGKGRFDFYSGLYSHLSDKNPFKKLGLADKTNKIQYVKLTGVRASQVLKSRAFPTLPKNAID
ncbi:hypothetical protein ACES2L_11020 [Bdellovibrio bacteriovorus]